MLDACDRQPSPTCSIRLHSHAGQGVLSDDEVVAMEKQLNRVESQRQTARGSWRARDFGTEGFSHGRLGVRLGGCFDVWPYLASLRCSLAFYSTFFASSLSFYSLSIRPRAATASLLTCEPAGPAPATEARRCVPGCSHHSRLNHSAVVCRPRLPGHFAAARLSCSICHRHQYRQCC